MAILYAAGTVNVVQNATVVTGTNTGWRSSKLKGAFLQVGGVMATISAIVGDGQLELALPWAGPSATDAAYAIAIQSEASADVVSIIKDTAALFTKTLGGRVIGTFNAFGDTLAERDGYDNQGEGFVFGHLRGDDIDVYLKRGAAPGDWYGPLSLRGEKGDTGNPIIVSETAPVNPSDGDIWLDIST